MANIYDGAFRTILNDCRKLIIPVINEIFGEAYTGEEEIRFFPNEHFLDQQDEADRERITDTNFTVFGKIPKKYHVECESSLPDLQKNTGQNEICDCHTGRNSAV